MRIIIVGAGLGGLSAAVCFTRKGHDVHVLEQRDAVSPVGGAIGIRPGATRIMHTWGLREKLENISDDMPATVIHSLQTGVVATGTIQADISDQQDWGTNRDVMIEMLFRKVKEAGTKITFGAKVVDVNDDGNKASVTLSNGTQIEADMVLAADGIRSRIRAQILSDLSEPTEPESSDLTLYGAHLEREDFMQVPELRSLQDEGYLHVHIGVNAFIVSRYGAKLQTWKAVFAIKEKTDQQGLWDENGDINYVRDFYKGSCVEMTKVLELVKSCDRWKIAGLPNLSRWTSKGGRIVLLGDSAHAMHPTAAQGFSQIVEDIGVLEYLISEDSDTIGNLPSITANWQKIRKPRVERIKEFALANSGRFTGHVQPATKQAAKWQTISLKHTKPDMYASFLKPEFMKWVHDYDAIGEAQKYLQGTTSRL